MSNHTNSGKFIFLGFLAGFIIVALVLTPFMISELKTRAMPEQTTQAKVIAKGQYTTQISGGLKSRTRYLSFEFPDGSRKDFRISSPTVFNTIN